MPTSNCPGAVPVPAWYLKSTSTTLTRFETMLLAEEVRRLMLLASEKMPELSLEEPAGVKRPKRRSEMDWLSMSRSLVRSI